MTLTEFFEALKNTNAVVTILDDEGVELVKIYAAGYLKLLADLLAREVAEFNVVSAQAITVKLAAV